MLELDKGLERELREEMSNHDGFDQMCFYHQNKNGCADCPFIEIEDTEIQDCETLYNFLSIQDLITAEMLQQLSDFDTMEQLCGKNFQCHDCPLNLFTSPRHQISCDEVFKIVQIFYSQELKLLSKSGFSKSYIESKINSLETKLDAILNILLSEK